MFNNKVVIITGSTQGIGLKTAELLAQRGALLIINSRRPEKVQTALAYLKQYTQHVAGLAGDVSDIAFCEELREFAVQQFGRIDILINNAGIAAGGVMMESRAEAFKKVIDINLLGCVYPTLACLPELCKQQGAVLFIGSVAGIAGLPSYSAYAASKRALSSLAESLRSELLDAGVFVGIHYPGFTENESDKTIMNARGEFEVLKKREGVKAMSREQTALNIIKQLEHKKFRMFSSVSAWAVYTSYRLFPNLFVWLLGRYRKKIMSMQ
ncbi:MAG: SDR family NAD(P)-dependent oxidoreductase [Bacteroidota bacterium]|jgi:short-subunit dehydrogenase